MSFCRFLKFSAIHRDWRSPGTLSSPKRASRLDGVHFFKKREFDDLCENSAFRRDWRSSAHLLEGLGPHASNLGWPKWLPQAPLRPRRTTQRTVVIGARPVHLLPQNGLLISTACTFSTICVCACFCSFRLSVVIGVRPAPTLDQYGLLASAACTFLRRLMLQTHTEPRRTIQLTVVIGARPSPKWASKSTTLAVVAALKTKIESKRPQTR